MSRVLSVCMITGEYPPAVGGVADYTANLTRALRHREVRVDVVTAAHEIDPGWPSATVTGWTWHGVGEVARHVRRLGSDLVHLQYQTAAFAMSPIINALPVLLRAHGVRAPFVTTFHDFRPPYLFPKAGPLRTLANYLLLSASQGTIFVDPADLSRAHASREAAWIPIGSNVPSLPPGDRSAGRRRFGIDGGDLVLGFFGFINASKGVDVLLRAAARLKDGGLPVRVLLIGESLGASDPTNRATASAMLALAHSLGIGESVTITGPLSAEEVSTTLALADLAVLPYVDGASLSRGSLLACLAHGLPVVTTPPRAQPGFPARHRIMPFDDPARFRIDEQVVFFTPVGDDAALAARIHDLAHDTHTRADRGAAARAFAAPLQWSAIADATAAFYGRLLGPATSDEPAGQARR